MKIFVIFSLINASKVLRDTFEHTNNIAPLKENPNVDVNDNVKEFSYIKIRKTSEVDYIIFNYLKNIKFMDTVAISQIILYLKNILVVANWENTDFSYFELQFTSVYGNKLDSIFELVDKCISHQDNGIFHVLKRFLSQNHRYLDNFDIILENLYRLWKVLNIKSINAKKNYYNKGFGMMESLNTNYTLNNSDLTNTNYIFNISDLTNTNCTSNSIEHLLESIYHSLTVSNKILLLDLIEDFNKTMISFGSSKDQINIFIFRLYYYLMSNDTGIICKRFLKLLRNDASFILNKLNENEKLGYTAIINETKLLLYKLYEDYINLKDNDEILHKISGNLNDIYKLIGHSNKN